MSFFNTATSTTAATPDKDIEVADPPPDSISSLGFSPQADYLAVGSWDNNVRVSLDLMIVGYLKRFSPGAHLRSWREWADPRKSYVLASGTGSERMLEQGTSLRTLSVDPPAHKDLQEGTRVISAGADNAGRMYDVQTGQTTQIAKHDAPIRVCKYVDTPSGGIVVTGSWDKTIKVRDDHAIQHQRTLT